jgi:hypothetical protein
VLPAAPRYRTVRLRRKLDILKPTTSRCFYAAGGDAMGDEYQWTQEEARALTDAGYMPLKVYLELCAEYGWKPKPDGNPAETPKRDKAAEGGR